jgi:hypothetical protein
MLSAWEKALFSLVILAMRDVCHPVYLQPGGKARPDRRPWRRLVDTAGKVSSRDARSRTSASSPGLCTCSFSTAP